MMLVVAFKLQRLFLPQSSKKGWARGFNTVRILLPVLSRTTSEIDQTTELAMLQRGKAGAVYYVPKPRSQL